MASGDAWLLLQARVIMAISYPLSLTSFTTKQCCRLSVILDNAMLPKLGINRKMKKTVIYAPRCLGGIGYPSFKYLQDSRSTTHFLRQLEWGGEVATNIRIVLSQFQLQSGFVTPLMEDASLPAPHLEQGWISHIRERLGDLGGCVVIKDQ